MSKPKGFGKALEQSFPLPEHLKAWQDGLPIGVLRNQDNQGYGHDLIFVCNSFPKEFEAVKNLIFPTLCQKVPERHKQLGAGFVDITPGHFLQNLGMSKPISIPKETIWFSWDYWSRTELQQINRDNLLLWNTNFLKPFLLWATKNYQPKKEMIVMLTGFPFEDDPERIVHAQIFRYALKGGVR